MHTLQQLLEVTTILTTGGYIALFFIVFAESGLFIGFFLPGDSLLFTAGFLASQDILNIWVIIPLAFTAAILGDSVGYAFGKRVGPKIFNKEDSLFFHKKHLLTAEEFYEKHGPKTIVIARFMPIVRTFAPIVAGLGKMRYSTFLVYNIIGAVLWGIGLPIVGYFLGSTIPGIDKYLLPIIVGIVFVSISPGAYHMIKEYRAYTKRLKDN